MFKKAERKQAKLKLAITGPSGSGKTFSALRLAKGLGGKIAVIDTENGSASLYSDKFEFDVVELPPPFTTEKYMAAMEAAIAAGFTVLVIDSLSHSWASEGGLLEQKEALDSRGKGNSYTNWAGITKKQNAFISSILHSPIHVIATMRSKQAYEQTEEGGKKRIKKLGMAPVQRDGVEYEFTTVFDIQMDHQAECSKDRSGLFTDRLFQITEKTGEELLKWLSAGKAEEPANPKLSLEDLKPLIEAVKKSGIPNEEIKKMIRTGYGVEDSRHLTANQLKEFTQHIETTETQRTIEGERLPFE